MSGLLRIEIFLLALAFLVYIIRTINKKKLQMRFSVIWILLALGLIFIALVPGVVFALTALVGMETPANLLYLCGIFLLLVVAFSHTVQISAQAEKIKTLVQQISLDNYFREQDHE